ncbi:MAG: DMT family transporter [Planctomycetota bacterium]
MIFVYHPPVLLLQDKLGEIAALGAAFCWVLTSLAFAGAGRRVGATTVNVIRIVLAVIMLAAVHRIAFGTWGPALDRTSLGYLAVSGVIGLALGDQLLFTALVDVGPRIATLLMTLAPPVAAALAWPVLDEPLGPLAIAGIMVTLVGIALVVLERPAGVGTRPHRHRVRGVIFGLGAALCQATGLVLAKVGIGHTRLPLDEHVSPWSATLVRMVFGAVVLVFVAGLFRISRSARTNGVAMQVSPESEHLPAGALGRNGWPLALLLIGVGAIFGPVVGVWCSLVAVDLAKAGIAATLMAMTPVFILPFSGWVERERLNWRAILGATVAVAGVGLLAST